MTENTLTDVNKFTARIKLKRKLSKTRTSKYKRVNFSASWNLLDAENPPYLISWVCQTVLVAKVSKSMA